MPPTFEQNRLKEGFDLFTKFKNRELNQTEYVKQMDLLITKYIVEVDTRNNDTYIKSRERMNERAKEKVKCSLCDMTFIKAHKSRHMKRHHKDTK